MRTWALGSVVGVGIGSAPFQPCSKTHMPMFNAPHIMILVAALQCGITSALIVVMWGAMLRRPCDKHDAECENTICEL